MPSIPFTEPVSPRYIHINPETNLVHLLVPVVGGQEISTDNTCKANVALKEFFDGEGLRDLKSYKSALLLDIGLLEVGTDQRLAKEARLVQIEAYMEAISAMKDTYGVAMTSFLARPSNLYSIQLRPLVQDYNSTVVNPAFNLERKNNDEGIPLSPLYNVMHKTFPGVVITVSDPRTTLTTAVLRALPALPNFEDIQQVLGEQCLTLFGLPINFKRRPDGTEANKAAIDALMRFEADTTPKEYIDALLGACAPDMWVTLPALLSPFYSIPTDIRVDKRTERLSMLTQFFLAHLSIYCKARGISKQNFGTILDASSALSNELVSVVSTALSAGDDVETILCSFCNVNADKFGLTRSLNVEDVTAIKEKFERTWRTVTATKENPNMDDFMILDKEATGEAAKVVSYKGAICVNFADIVDPTAASSNPDYFASIRADFASHPSEMPNRNESVASEINMDVESLLARVNDEQFERLNQATKDACRAHPTFRARKFLHNVAKGRQEEAEAVLTATPANTQTLLQTPGIFTDYSGRTFNCTAYEYAYWAKDTHMCRMLESHMDEETKAFMLERIDANDAAGLMFQQNGEEHQQAHFDLSELKTALQVYIDGYDAWDSARDRAAINKAWMAVGKAQRNVPVHIAQEYCREDRSFSPTPQFNEAALPRVVTFDNVTMGANDSWFPLLSANSGLGFDFGLIRGVGTLWGWSPPAGVRVASAPAVQQDLAAITRLDEVRTVDLSLSRDHLKPSVTAPGISM